MTLSLFWLICWFGSLFCFLGNATLCGIPGHLNEEKERDHKLRFVARYGSKEQDCSSATSDPSKEMSRNAVYSNLSTTKMNELFGQPQGKRMGLIEFQKRVMNALKDAQNPLDSDEIQKLFSVNDADKDGFLNEKELYNAYDFWLRRILAPVNALVVVDVQNDFVNGSLAVKDGEAIIPVINHLLKKVNFDVVAYTFDYHPANHISFYTNVNKFKLDPSSPIQDPSQATKFSTVIFDTRFGPAEQTLWPPHCVQGTKGCELFPDLYVRPDNFFVYKGMETDIESYTAFGEPSKGASTCLDSSLRSRGVTEIFTVGLAADVCVAFTGQDALKLGYGVAMVEDGARPVYPDRMNETKRSVESLGGHYCDSETVIEGQGFTLDDRVSSLRHALQKV